MARVPRGPWSNVPPARTVDDQAATKSTSGQPPSVPARLPALDVRHWSRDDVPTNVEDGGELARREPGSAMEDVKMEDGSRSGKSEQADDPECGKSHQEKNDDDAATKDGSPDKETHPQEANESKHTENSTNQPPRHEENVGSLDASDGGDRGTDVSRQGGDLTAPEKIKNFQGSPRSQNEAKSQRGDAQEMQQSEENDSGGQRYRSQSAGR